MIRVLCVYVDHFLRRPLIPPADTILYSAISIGMPTEFLEEDDIQSVEESILGIKGRRTVFLFLVFALWKLLRSQVGKFVP